MTLRHYLALVDTLARLSLKADASRYFLGYIWWLLEPLLYVLVFYVVFELILQNRQEDFLVFLMVGKLSFIWFAKSLNQASRSILGNRGLIGRVHVPKSLFPMASIQEGLYKQASVFLLLFTVLVSQGFGATLAWLWLLPVLLVNYLLIVACCLAGAWLVCVKYDFHVLVSMGVIFLMFTSGVFWDPRALPDPAMTDAVLLYNPLAFVIAAYRQVLMLGAAPDLLHLAAIGTGFALIAAALFWLLQRSSQYIALKVITA